MSKHNCKWYESHRVNENEVIERKCSGCGEWMEENDINYYLKNKSHPEKGFSPECRPCSSKRTQANTAKKHDEVVAYISEYNKIHADEQRKRRRKHYEENKEKERQRTVIFIKNNPDKSKKYRDNHRNHDITDSEWHNCKNKFDNKCAYCGLSIEKHTRMYGGKLQYIDLHKEHVDDNGANDIRNCVPCCGSCNSTKGNYTIYELLEMNAIPEFTEEKLAKIIWWTTEGYKDYIEDKPPYKITRRRIKLEDNTYKNQNELWTVDEYRDLIECIAIADTRKELTPYIKRFF
jgi:hypothetical protein